MSLDAYRAELRKLVPESSADKVMTIGALIEVLCEPDDEACQVETAYAYYTGRADWQNDAEDLL